MVIIYTRAYNAEKTIRTTIDSVLNQTYTNFQYIILDNGSLDNTHNILREYAKKDKRIIILSNEVNVRGFLSNVGILRFIVDNYSEDDYFCNIDADDIYESTFFENMLNFCNNNNLDFAFSGYNRLEKSSGELIETKVLSEDFVITNSELSEYFIKYRRYTTDMWAKFFKVALLEFYLQSDRFDHYKTMNTQQSFIFDALSNSARIGFLAKPLFNYYESNIAQKNARLQGNVNGMWACNIISILKEFLDNCSCESEIILKKNYDYMYAIYCGYIKDVFLVIKMTNAMSFSQKIITVCDIVRNPIMKQMLLRNASEEFYSLSKEYKRIMCQDIIDYFIGQTEKNNYINNIEFIIDTMRQCNIDIISD